MTDRLAQIYPRMAAFFAVLIAFTALTQSADAAQPGGFRPGKVLIIPKADKIGQTAELHRQKGRHVGKRFPDFKNLEVVELPAGQDVLATVKEYLASGLVESAEPDFILYKSVVPDDPSYDLGTQWDLNRIDAAGGWDVRHDATNIVVAVVDTGMRLTHQDLAPNLWTNTKEIPGNGIDDDGDGYIDDVHGINAITGSGAPNDDEGHGSHVAGIIGGVGNNGKGIAGVAWNVQLMPLKFMDATGSGATSDAVECVNYAIKHGANVINGSFGSTNFSSTLQAAISSARTAGIVFVAAAGNERADNDLTPSYPASYTLDNVISVAATTSSDTFESIYSNYGATSVDIGAPGTSIYSCGIDSDTSYVYMSGTSMATPVITGAVALMKAQFPTETPAQLRQRLMATADLLPSLAGKCVSGGRVNLRRALLPYVSSVFTPSAVAGAFPLTVQFTNQSVGSIASYRWDFGDGSVLSTATNATHIFSVDGNFTVTLTVTGTNGATSSAQRQIAVEPSYAYKSVAYEWIDPTAMTPFTLADNGVSGAQDLPFTFYFFGQPKTKIYIGANGLIGFDQTNMATTSNADIPTAASPNGTILPYWDNLNPSSAGAVYAGVAGEAPNRRYVVSWVGVVRNSSNDKMTFQAVLSETTGKVQFNYQEVNPTSIRGGGARATIGLEDPSGLIAAKYCYDGAPNRVANGQSLLFVADGVGGLTVTPEVPAGFVGSALELEAQNVTFTVKNTSARPLLWSAGNLQPWLALSANGGALDPQAEAQVVAQVNSGVAALADGAYSDTVSFLNLNNGHGDAQRFIGLELSTKFDSRFNTPTFANGVFHFEIPGAIGASFVIEASSDLVTWQEVLRGAIDASGVIPYSDGAAVSEGNRFFRAQVLP